MIVDKVWKLTNTVRVGLDARSSHAQRQSTFPDNVCSYCPPVTVCHTLHLVYLFIMNKQRQYTYVGVGDMKDYKLKLRNLRVSHTLSWSWSWNT
jgi:hypothetical protein